MHLIVWSGNMRKAIAMIELIFAMVIIGIALLSAPMFISVASKSTSVALQQEGINQAASRLNMILTYNWDEKNNKAYCVNRPSVLEASPKGDTELKRGTNDRREGTSSNSASHTYKCLSPSGIDVIYKASDTLGGDLDDLGRHDDIDDFSGTSLVQIVNSGSGGTDYLEKTTVHMHDEVVYADDRTIYNTSTMNYIFKPNGNMTSSTNIKRVSVSLTSSHASPELQKNITLHAFSCNLGSYNYYKKKIP